MLILILIVALMVITAAIAMPAISFSIKRDREQEMIHRGVQYSRAIRSYYKKFGRYPTRLEDLDNTNNLRYLRKHYKDPLTGQDFRLLHYGEPGVTLAGGIAGGSIPGANAIGAPNGPNNSSGFGQPSAFGGTASNSFGGGNNSFGGNANSAFGGNANNAFGANSNPPAGANSSAATPPTGTDPSQNPSTPIAKDATSTKAGSTDDSSAGQLVASGPIVGVASTSKKNTIREYNKKKKYNEWQFVYDPGTDRGGLITTPNQPSLTSLGSGGGIAPPQNSSPGNSNSSPFGQPSGFGNQASPFGNSPTSGAPTPPPSSQPQQQ